MGRYPIAVRVLAAVALLGGLAGCAAPQRAPGGRPFATQAHPAELPPRTRLPLDRLPALPALPEATELVDRTVPAAALKHYLAGAALVEDYRDAEAIEQFEAAMAADPAGFEPRLALGRAGLRAGDLPKARAALEAAVRQRPRSCEAHYLLGLTAATAGTDAASLLHLRQSLALADNDGQRIRIYFHLAQVLQREDYCQAAVDAAQRFESLVDQDVSKLPLLPVWRDLVMSQGWRIPALRGACLRRLDRPAEAVKAYEAALAMSPNTEVLLALGETLIDAGDLRRAADVSDRLLSLEPGNTAALAMLAGTMIVQNRQAELRARLMGLLDNHPSDLVLAQRVAAIFLKAGQMEAALDALLTVRKGLVDPSPVYAALMQIVLAGEEPIPAVEGLAHLLERLGPGERDALVAPIDSLRVNPGLVRALASGGPTALAAAGRDATKLLALGLIAGAASQPVIAESALRAAVARQPDSRLAAVQLGSQLLVQCRWQDAIAFTEPLTSRFKDDADLYRILGTAHDGLDDLKAAMANYYEALRCDRRDTRSMWRAAQINDRLGQAQPASAIYQVLVTLKPDAWEAHLALVKDLLALRQKDAALEHARRLKEAMPSAAAADLCLLIAGGGDTVPPAAKVAELLRQHPDDLNLRQALAEALLAEGDAAAATAQALRILADDPASEDARLLLTTSLSRQLQLDLAMQVLDSLLAEHPNRTLWRFAKAELLAQMGQPEDAAQIILELMKTPWGQEQKRALEGRLVFFLHYAGQEQRVLSRLERALKESPGSRTEQALLLGVLEACGKRAEALEMLRRWRSRAPDDALLRRLQIQLLRQSDAHDAATAEVLLDWPAGKEPSGKDPPSRPSRPAATREQDLLQLASVLPASQAAEWLTARSWMGPTDLTGVSLAQLAVDRDEYREAIELGRLAPQDEEAVARGAQWSYLSGDLARAELVLLPQVQTRGGDAYGPLNRLRATFYRRLGLTERAVRQTEVVYRQSMDGDRAGEAANDLAYVYAERGQNLLEAEQMARQAVAGDPSSAACMDTLAWVCYRQGRFQDALRWIRQAVRVPGQGQDPVLQEHLGDILWRVGEPRQAAEAWRRASALYMQLIKTDRLRPDLREGLDSVTAKCRAVESRKPPPVEPRAGRSRGR